MDQTEFSMNAGYIFGMAPGAMYMKELTCWTGWIAYPIGALIGVLIVALLVFF